MDRDAVRDLGLAGVEAGAVGEAQPQRLEKVRGLGGAAAAGDAQRPGNPPRVTLSGIWY
jgi:hypothetical protein